ncbi:hypothetical protein VTJ49DRAFT_6806 [Mycothermus thermophilus]|uniref:DOMON domain-containing protein n=1 Tax=Humicola insolens TaxID=85995 RepID=A0ABR3VIG2_HUMIN
MKLTPSWWAAGLLAAGHAVAAPVEYCPEGANAPCFSIAIPTSSANAGSGNIYFQIKAPAALQWAALGTGTGMIGANIFLMYRDGEGNVTISARRTDKYDVPMQDTSSTAARLTLLEGSGVQADGSLIANVACANCESWGSGEMSLTSTSAPWIGAWVVGQPIGTTNANSRIGPHDDTTQFRIDLTKATISYDGNPFLASSPVDDSSGDNGNNNNSNNSNNSGVVEVVRSSKPAILVAHGVILALVFAVLYPTGSLMMPLVKKWWFHGLWQAVSFGLMWAGFGLGVVVARDRNMLFDQTHTIYGTVIIAALGLQPFFGYLHHLHYLKHRSRGVISYLHIWYGRVLMALGVVNGALGLRLARESDGFIIAYSVVAGVVFVSYGAFTAFKAWRRGGCREGADADGAKEARLQAARRGRDGEESSATTTTTESPPSASRSLSETEPIADLFASLQSTRKAVAAVSRLATRRAVPVRTFMAPTVSRRADFVQELYLKELKAYKPAPIKESDAVGQVAVFSLPKAPKSPEEADLASSLKEYEQMAVEVEGQEGDAAAQTSTPVLEDWLVEEEEEGEHH